MLICVKKTVDRLTAAIEYELKIAVCVDDFMLKHF